MNHRRLLLLAALFLLATTLRAQTERGPYARIAVLRPHDGDTIDFEAGYIRHLEWHRQAKDPWTWYGWTIWAGERQRWFVYATFGHTAADFDNSVSPAEDERDNIANVTPHAQFVANALYEFLPALSRGSGEPQPAARVELTIVELLPGSEKAFEAALGAEQAALQGETLWYRMVAGGAAPRYVRLRPRPSLAAIIAGASEQALPAKVDRLIAKTTVEILTLRRTMSYGLTPPP
ncbi:MAG TPA: hypothetical protein VN605_00865 [Thermoanaerobaculia bacterium]|nr:hypothetical protein [Thermoanaerobaculia bacterium]